LLPLCLLLAGALLPHTTPGSKLLSSFGLTPVDSQNDEIGLGTKAGRDLAWRLVEEYVARTDQVTFGVGFGQDYLFASGARRPLGNSGLLRQPHSFIVGTYARLGLVGLGLLALVLLGATVAGVRLRRLAGSDDLLLLAVVVPVAFAVSGAVGVQIESPFGAVPFYWFLGILLARGRADRLQDRQHRVGLQPAWQQAADDQVEPTQQAVEPALPGRVVRQQLQPPHP
jgi:hypothetical protein